MGKIVKAKVAKISTTVTREKKPAIPLKKTVCKTTTFKAKDKQHINANRTKTVTLSKSNTDLVSATPPSNAKWSKQSNKKQPIASVPKSKEPPQVVPEKRINKKEKIKNRRDNLMQKFDLALKKSVQLKAKAKTNRKQKINLLKKKSTQQGVKSAMADMSMLTDALPTLNDALPSLNSLFQLKSKHLKTGVPKFEVMARKVAQLKAMPAAEPTKLTKTTKTLNKKNEFMQRYNYLHMLTTNKEFKQSPREMIAAHVRKQLVE